MASGNPADDPGTPTTKQPLADSSIPPTSQPAAEPNGDAGCSQAGQGPQGQQYYSNGVLPHDSTRAEPGGGHSVPYHDMSVLPYNTDIPMTRPKRTQCKNACINCKRACKKCDDNRPCHRCIRYGTMDTCVDSKRKERKKGFTRGPYKTRDKKGRATDAANNDGSSTSSANSTLVLSPNTPYVSPVNYLPGMWSSYFPGGPDAKTGGGGYYQPVVALTPLAGQTPHSADGESARANAGGTGPPHFPVGFYPPIFISYPGPYPPYPMPHGFHYAYPPPGVHQPRPPNMAANNADDKPGVTAQSSDDLQNKDTPDSDATADGNGDAKDVATDPQVIGKVTPAEGHGVEKDNE